MNREGKRGETGIGADVRRCLVSPDMLLARRKGQDEAAAAQGIHCLAAETPRHLAQIFGLGGEEPNIRTAEIQAIADRLAFARDNIGAHRSRRLDKAERDSLGEYRDEKRALCLAARGHVRKIAEIAEEIRALHNNAGSFIVDKSAEILGCEDIGW